MVNRDVPFRIDEGDGVKVIPADPDDDVSSIADDADAVFVGEGEDEDEGGFGGFPGAPGGQGGIIPVPVAPGTPVAQALPIASAEAGPGGLAQVGL